MKAVGSLSELILQVSTQQGNCWVLKIFAEESAKMQFVNFTQKYSLHLVIYYDKLLIIYMERILIDWH